MNQNLLYDLTTQQQLDLKVQTMITCNAVNSQADAISQVNDAHRALSRTCSCLELARMSNKRNG